MDRKAVIYYYIIVTLYMDRLTFILLWSAGRECRYRYLPLGLMYGQEFKLCTRYHIHQLNCMACCIIPGITHPYYRSVLFSYP